MKRARVRASTWFNKRNPPGAGSRLRLLYIFLIKTQNKETRYSVLSERHGLERSRQPPAFPCRAGRFTWDCRSRSRSLCGPRGKGCDLGSTMALLEL